MPRGVRRNANRGIYLQSTEEARRRVIEGGDEWAFIAAAQGIKKSTAYNWIRRGRVENLPKGGPQRNVIKLQEPHINALVERLSENCQLTLREMAEYCLQTFDLTVSEQTISRALHGRLYTVKKIYHMPENANNDRNKALRRDYVGNILEAVGQNKTIVYIDESNVNLFVRRSQGRERRGERAVVRMPFSKGPNVHMIAGLTQNGLVNVTRRRGSFRHEDFNNWLIGLVNYFLDLGENPRNLVIVMDNAPCHSRAEEIVQTFPELTILRLSPYSPMLNPIESAWSSIKANIKELHRNRINDLFNGDPNNQIRQYEWRLRHLETIIDESWNVVTPLMCMRFINHCSTFYVPALNQQDIQFGH